MSDTVPTPLATFPVRTPSQLRTALATRNLSQLRLAALTGCDPRTVRRWVDTRPATGDRQLPRHIQALIHVTLTIYDQDHAIASAPNDAPDAPASCDPASLPPLIQSQTKTLPTPNTSTSDRYIGRRKSPPLRGGDYFRHTAFVVSDVSDAFPISFRYFSDAISDAKKAVSDTFRYFFRCFPMFSDVFRCQK